MKIKETDSISKEVNCVGSLPEALKIQDAITNNYAPNWDIDITKEELKESMQELLSRWDI